MNYWITTQRPYPESFAQWAANCGVYLQEGREHVAASMRPGDLAFRYESKTGPYGNDGRMGIVAIMEVTDRPKDMGNPAPVGYANGSERWWRYKANATCKDADGFVSRADLNTILGYVADNKLRGFGDDHSGLKRIDKSTYDKIYAAFKNSDV